MADCKHQKPPCDEPRHVKLPCDEYYLFNCGACGGNEFACPACEHQHQYVVKNAPKFVLCQLDANPGCGQCCMPSFDGKIVCDAIQRCICPNPWAKSPFSNNMNDWNKQICTRCFHPDCCCRPHKHVHKLQPKPCVSPLRAPLNKKLIEYRGDTSSSGHVQQMAYRAIFKGNGTENSPCVKTCHARSYPPVPVLAPSVKCDKLDLAVSYCPQRFANQNRTVQYISGHIGVPGAINDKFDPIKCCTETAPRDR